MTGTTVFRWNLESYWEYRQECTHSNWYHAVGPSPWLPTQQGCIPIQVNQIEATMLLCRTRPIPSRNDLPKSPSLSFEHYVSTLHAWEQDMLQGVHLYLSPYEIHHYLLTGITPDQHLYLVSDGSQQGEELSYGWVLGTDNGFVFAEQAGPGYGMPTSHRAEGWGMLSGTLFMYHLYKYIQLKPEQSIPNTLNFYCDNLGLITRINQRRKYQFSYPNATLVPDWDLVEQICVLINKIPHDEILHHWVKGHQTDFDEMPVEAHYNVQADELTGCFLWPTATPVTPKWILPVEKIRLVIDNTPVYGNYTHAIRQAYTIPPLFA